MRIALPVVVSGLLTTQALAADLSVNIEIPVLNVAEYHRPYVAMWIERSNQSVAANLAVWFDLKQKNNDGTKWLKDLRQWWRRSGRELAMPVDGLSGATRAAGRAPGHLEQRQVPARRRCPPASTSSSSRPREKSAGASCCACRFSGRPRPPATAKVSGEHELGAVTLNLKP